MPGGAEDIPGRRCVYETHRRGPVSIYSGKEGVTFTSERDGGGSSAIVSLENMSPRPPEEVVWQGMIVQLLGRTGSSWTPLRQNWAPVSPVGNACRQVLQYQGAAVSQFKVIAFLVASGLAEGSRWASQIDDLSIELVVGDGTGGNAPGAAFLLTGRAGVMVFDLPSVSSMPERRRLTLELLSTDADEVGFSWFPLTAEPAQWIPLRVGEPRTLNTSAPVYIQTEPPGMVADVAVIEELG